MDKLFLLGRFHAFHRRKVAVFDASNASGPSAARASLAVHLDELRPCYYCITTWQDAEKPKNEAKRFSLGSSDFGLIVGVTDPRLLIHCIYTNSCSKPC